MKKQFYRSSELPENQKNDSAEASKKTRPIDATPNSGAPETTPAAHSEPPKPAARPKTRPLGHGRSSSLDNSAVADDDALPVVGWLVVFRGPGSGKAVGLVNGMNAVGRGEDQTVQLDFGDETISRATHAYVVYDDEERMFHVSHGGKQNLVRLNGKPVLNSEPLNNGDLVRLGATTLRFCALCGPDFDWSDE